MDPGKATIVGAIVAAVAATGGIVLTKALSEDPPKGSTSMIATAGAGATTETFSPPSTIPTSLTPQATAVAEADLDNIRHESDLTLAASGSVELDSTPDNYQWDGGSTDITWSDSSRSIKAYAYSEMVRVGHNDGTVCQQSSGYSRRSIPAVVDRMFCVRTDGGRFSFIQILAIHADSIDLHIRTYKKPDE